jgi:hypothetical protein
LVKKIRQVGESNMDARVEDVYAVVLLAILAVATVFLVALVAKPMENAYGLPLLMIFGVIDLFVVLAIAGQLFSKTNLACRDEALGLPQGSIRALIALSLIIIFAIMAIFMYGQLVPNQSNMLHFAANETFVFPNGTAIMNPDADTYVMVAPSDYQQQFSSQILTTVSTLVVALAGFYFGTKAVSVARGGEEKEEKEPSYGVTVKPAGELVYKGKPLSIEIGTEPKGEPYNFTVDGDKSDSVKMGEASNEVVYTEKDRNKNVVTITFSLKGKPKVVEKITIIFEKLELVTKGIEKIKAAKPQKIEYKTIPEGAKVEANITGDQPGTLVRKGNSEFTYTPSNKGPDRPGDFAFLTFELKGKPKITKDLKIEVEP